MLPLAKRRLTRRRGDAPCGRDRPMRMAYMGKLTFGRLSEAWAGEATDSTPLPVERLDQLGEALGVDLVTAGQSEVNTTGGRRIDIVADSADGTEFVIENQYGRADHDHLTRGLAYAVARNARRLVVVAEEHRDEFRAVAQYLNDLAEHDPEHGIAVWLVEARAVRVDGGPWAPLFTAVVEPNQFTMAVERARASEPPASVEDVLRSIESEETRMVVSEIVTRWTETAPGYRCRPRQHKVVLEAPGPSVNGWRVVVAISAQGGVGVPFGSYAGLNTGLPVEELCSEEFLKPARELFGFTSDKQTQTGPGWVNQDRKDALMDFCFRVARAYGNALNDSPGGAGLRTAHGVR